MAKSKYFYIRKAHRYLGVILGIQFLIWTISGLYFSWTNIDEIHGDFQRRDTPELPGNLPLISPAYALTKLNPEANAIEKVELVAILGKPFYYIQYGSGRTSKKLLADAISGNVRSPITKDESVRIAAESFKGSPNVKSVEYLTSTHGHHEYRKKPLPAWAVTFNHPSNITVYVSAEGGKVESFRNNKWRLFDFLWMGHTMDYQNRDNFNNWLLRIFSAFGFVTILSGFALFFTSSKFFRKRRSFTTRDN